LKEHLVDDFGVTYRYYLERPEAPLRILAEGVWVEPVDPLFLMKEGRYYVAPAKDGEAPDRGGAIQMENLFLLVRYFEDPENR
jgi:hypothetical protein